MPTKRRVRSAREDDSVTADGRTATRDWTEAASLPLTSQSRGRAVRSGEHSDRAGTNCQDTGSGNERKIIQTASLSPISGGAELRRRAGVKYCDASSEKESANHGKGLKGRVETFCRWSDLSIALLVGLSVAVPYYNALGGDFVFDDVFAVQENRDVVGPYGICIDSCVSSVSIF